jgi:hypothetical protein
LRLRRGRGLRGGRGFRRLLGRIDRLGLGELLRRIERNLRARRRPGGLEEIVRIERRALRFILVRIAQKIRIEMDFGDSASRPLLSSVCNMGLLQNIGARERRALGSRSRRSATRVPRAG